jgi:dephospho-CoA kinase
VQKNKSRTVIGITGSFGSGKSTVAEMFKDCGARIIDADAIVHQLLRPGSAVSRRICAVFGPQVIAQDGSVERSRLASVVFKNARLVRLLNSIVHPQVKRIIKRQIQGMRGMIVVDAPLLLEAGVDSLVDYVVVVKAPLSAQIARLKKRHHYTIADIRLRIKAQMPLAEKIARADFIIDNSASRASAFKQVRAVVFQVQSRMIQGRHHTSS